MRKYLLLIAMIAVAIFSHGQTTITNSGFETWDSVGTAGEEPSNWNSNKTGGGNAGSSIAPQTCFRETSNPHSGNYCAKVKSGLALGVIVVNGALTTGKVEAPSTSKAEGYIHTIAGNATYGMAFTGRPDSIAFWIRYTPSGSDSPRVEARLHIGNAYAPEAPVNSNHPDSSVNIIARAVWVGHNAAISSWTRVCLPFTYVDSRTPEYILVTSTSSASQTGGSNNSTMWLDDFEAVYNPAIATGAVSTGPYYVSSSTGTSINIPYTLTGTFTSGNVVTAYLSDATGSFASQVNIGSVTSTASGTITATIPAGTPSGTGYRVRVASSTPALTAGNNNGSDIIITNVSNSIAPGTAQTIAANTNGTQLTVTESLAANTHEWKYATNSGGPYTSFSTAQTGSTYTPNFANAGTYYVVCVSSYTGLDVTSNEVQVNVVANSIAPSSTQSILVGVNGNLLTVNETPAGTAREWKYATASGGPYASFGTAETGTTYTPNFAASGNYYVVCISTISGIDVTSNEVQISVNNVTLSTAAIPGSPFQFSPSAPAISVTVTYTASGNFNNGNIFTAQLSDANGSFVSPTTIGSVTDVASGSISASIPSATPAGTGYRIRVVGSDPIVSGTDNGTDLVVDQFHNSISPTAVQNIMYATNGTALSVSASQNATHEWKYSITSGSGYVGFSTAETGTGYTPNFATPGTYYVICESKNQYNDVVQSNEVQINVQNGSVINTSSVTGSPYLVSASANVQVSVPFTSDAVFNNNSNVFTAQLSDYTGSFTNPVNIGTLSGSTVGPISAVIPNSSPAGSAYRIRVVSTDPAITGADNGTDLQVIPFEIAIGPLDTQYIAPGQNGTAVIATLSQPCTYQWLKTDLSGTNYTPFNPNETGDTLVPKFTQPGVYYVICKGTNAVSDAISSQEIVMIVDVIYGINETQQSIIKAYWSGNSFMVDMTGSNMEATTLDLMDITGRIVLHSKLNSGMLNTLGTRLPRGIYLFKIADGNKTFIGKTAK